MAKVSKLYTIKVASDVVILYDICQSNGDTVRINEISITCDQNLNTDPDVYEEGLLASMLEGLIFSQWKMLIQYLDHPNMMDGKETKERVIRSMIDVSGLSKSFSVDGQTITVIKDGGLFS